jgi:signal transduction histidine kinase
MTFRTRLLLSFAALAAVPLVLLAYGVRREVGERLTAQYRARAADLVTTIAADLERQSDGIAARLAGVSLTLADDARFRLGSIGGVAADRAYVLDLAGEAMRIAGLGVLQIQDSAGRILSSGHFRNEFDRLDPIAAEGLAAAGPRAALLRVRTPTGPALALARVDSLALGGRRLSLVGGVIVDSAVLRTLAGDPTVGIALELPDTVVGDAIAPDTAADAVLNALPLPLVDAANERTATARLHIAYPLGPLRALQRSVDRWFLVALSATVAIALALALGLAARLSQPLHDLASTAQGVELERGPVILASGRTDEVGVLARVLERMVSRLRSDAMRLREVERKATLGDLARQVNHDVRNGLAPIRNVFRHLAQTAEQDPGSLATVFAERRETVESSIAYLERLAGNYARLHPERDLRPCDVHAILQEVAATEPTGPVRVEVVAAEAPLMVRTDPLMVRRILENLTRNAVEAVAGTGGAVRLAATAVSDGIRLEVCDTGPGMTRDEMDRAFEPFHTTKADGTGLGLPIVRRLVMDLGGTLRVETAPGSGTTFVIELPGTAGEGARA